MVLLGCREKGGTKNQKFVVPGAQPRSRRERRGEREKGGKKGKKKEKGGRGGGGGETNPTLPTTTMTHDHPSTISGAANIQSHRGTREARSNIMSSIEP